MATELYVPGTTETDPKKQNRSLQVIGSQTATNTDAITTANTNITSLQTTVTSSSTFGLAKVDGTTITAASGVISAVAPPIVLLNTLIASSSATLSDTTSFTAAYSAYEIIFENLVPATTSTSAEIQVHSGGSFQTTGYLANSLQFSSGGSSSTAQTTFIPASSTTSVVNTVPGVSGTIRIYNPSSTTTPKHWTGQFSYLNGAVDQGCLVSGYWNANGAVDGFQFLFSTGNIASGKIKIYGIT